MAGNYQVVLRNSAGELITQANDFISLDYVLGVNSVGSLNLVLPGYYEKFLILNGELLVDTRIDILRSVHSDIFLLEGGTQWLVRQLEKRAWRPSTISLIAVSANHLLSRRIVAYDAGTAEALKTMNAEQMMHEIVNENLILPTDSTRIMQNVVDQVASFYGGAGLTKEFARRGVLETLQEIADSSILQGSYLAFDMIALPNQQFQFETFRGQRGRDLRTILPSQGPNYGTMGESILLLDYTGEITFVYAGGEGEEGARVVGSAFDSERMTASVYNRIEGFVDARTTDDPTALNDEAYSALRVNRAIRSISGAITDASGLIYGLDYGFGDYLRMVFGGQALDIRVDAVHITVADNRETIDVKFRGDI